MILMGMKRIIIKNPNDGEDKNGGYNDKIEKML